MREWEKSTRFQKQNLSIFGNFERIFLSPKILFKELSEFSGFFPVKIRPLVIDLHYLLNVNWWFFSFMAGNFNRIEEKIVQWIILFFPNPKSVYLSSALSHTHTHTHTRTQTITVENVEYKKIILKFDFLLTFFGPHLSLSEILTLW